MKELILLIFSLVIMVFIIFIIGILLIMISVPFRHVLPKKYTCDIMEWHSVITTGHNGVSYVGVCEKCGKRLMRDSQGNWF